MWPPTREHEVVGLQMLLRGLGSQTEQVSGADRAVRVPARARGRRVRRVVKASMLIGLEVDLE